MKEQRPPADGYPLVTIGIPTYNRADGYLREALKSALDQTYGNVEIVVSDNCSTDGTEALTKSLADGRVRYFRQESNIPANDNFNFCLQQARGAYFLLLHDDDKIDNDFVETCMRAADYATDVGIIRTGARVIDADGKVLEQIFNDEQGRPVSEFFYRWLCRKTLMLLCCTLFNTGILIRQGGFNSRHQLFQDVLAEFKLAATDGRVDVRDVKASFRKHPEQHTHGVKVRQWAQDSRQLLETMCELVPEDKGFIQAKGKRYFSTFNYILATGVSSPVERYKAYLMVYRMFDYRRSPLHFFIRRSYRRIKDHLILTRQHG